MKNWLTKYFIPQEENDHQPHLLRNESVLFLATILVGVEVLFLLQAFVVLPHSKFFAFVIPNVLVDETNANRQLYDLSPLRPNALLEVAAMEKAQDMAAKGYFAHTSPEGLTPWYWMQQVGYRFAYAGENLAVNFVDSSDVTNAWMNSPTHKENILNGNFTEIGIATSQGIYEGHQATFVVEMFGKPNSIARVSSPSLPGVPTASAAEQLPQKPIVTAETTSTGTSGSETFVAVKGEETSSVTSSPIVAGVANNSVEEPIVPLQDGGMAALVASPRATANYVFYAVGLLTILALALNIFVKVRIQHAQLIMNGLLILLLVGGVFLFNQYLATAAIKIL
ncbi:MAG: CAP domain-containing protein [Patescibacteria group bacterium]|nr:CAP domain-containing protein [Patescibacteria group bacterium]MDE2226870.1 CAP domain-containing protein [Patescibacteria group bacterium]